MRLPCCFIMPGGCRKCSHRYAPGIGTMPTKSKPAPRLKGQTLGIIGYGRIGPSGGGQKRAGWACKLSLTTLIFKLATTRMRRQSWADLDTLLASADFVSLHTPLTTSSRQIIKADTLSKMKRTAYLINTARGELIDEEALLSAVREGVIAGAALDVLTIEPPPPDFPLLHEERIIVTPHGAWYSEAATLDVRRKAIEDVIRVLTGQTPRSPVNQPAGSL